MNIVRYRVWLEHQNKDVVNGSECNVAVIGDRHLNECSTLPLTACFDCIICSFKELFLPYS